MMYAVTSDSAFSDDFRRAARLHPWVKREFAEAVRELISNGMLPESYGAHLLDNPGGNYNGHVDFHLSDGRVDVVVLYLPHKTNPKIRFVRMGTHKELFQGLMR